MLTSLRAASHLLPWPAPPLDPPMCHVTKESPRVDTCVWVIQFGPGSISYFFSTPSLFVASHQSHNLSLSFRPLRLRPRCPRRTHYLCRCHRTHSTMASLRIRRVIVCHCSPRSPSEFRSHCGGLVRVFIVDDWTWST
jgi:hypothetical protein